MEKSESVMDEQKNTNNNDTKDKILKTEINGFDNLFANGGIPRGNSVLVAADKPQALAQGIKKVLSDTNLVAKITKQALKDVKEYSWDKRAEKIIGFLK